MKYFKYSYYILWSLIIIAGISHMNKHFFDYPVYELAGLKVLQGKGLEIYDKGAILGGFYYPYFFALMFAPLSLMGFFGKIVFYVLHCLSFIKIINFSIKNSLSLLKEDNTKFYYPICLIVLISSINAINNAFLNSNIGVFLIVLAIYAFELKDKRPFIAGLLIAMAVVFKIYPALILCFFVWNKNWKMVASALFFTLLFYLGAPFLLNGFENGILLLKNQYTVLSHYGNHWPLDSISFQNLSSTILRAFPSLEVKHVLIPTFILILIGFMPSFLKNKKDLKETFVLKMFFLILALTAMLTPVSWYNMALFYTPIIAYTLTLAIAKKYKPAIVSFISFFVLFCLTTPSILGNKLNDLLEYYALPFFGLLIIVLFFIPEIKKDRA